MDTKKYEKLNADLGFEFDLFAVQHDAWMAKHVPNGALIVLQTDDAGFNKWARTMSLNNRRFDDDPDRPIVLVHIKKLRPQRSRIAELEAEVLEPTAKPRGKALETRRVSHDHDVRRLPAPAPRTRVCLYRLCMSAFRLALARAVNGRDPGDLSNR